MSRKRICGIVLLLIVVVGGVFFGHRVFAEGYSWISNSIQNVTWAGTGSSTGTCESYMACQGYSWVYYESLLGDGDELEVQFRPDMTANDREASQNVTIPAECSKKGGGFWHFGQNALAITNSGVSFGYFANYAYVNGSSSNVYTYSTTNGSYGHIFTISWQNGKNNIQNKTNLSQILYNNGTPVYAASTSRTDTWSDFLAAWKFEHNNVEYGGSDYPSDLWGFCYGEWMNQQYYTSSKVTVDGTTKDTGPSEVWAEADIPDNYNNGGFKMYRVGDQATVTISHNIYAKEREENKKQWRVVNRNIYVSNGFDRANITESLGSVTGAVHDAALTSKQGEYYVANSSGKITESTYTVKFATAGDVTICETIELVDEGRKTGACAALSAPPGDPTFYYARSNVAIVGGKNEKNWETTGITDDGSKSVSENGIKKNETRQIIFSHNVYASKQVSNGASVTLTRSFTGSGYQKIAENICPPTWYNLAKFDNKDGDYYVGDPRACTDGEYNYMFREIYDIKFTQDKKTADFCESISVDGKKKTTVCAHVSTGYDPPTIIDKPTGCESWTPSSYTSSGAESGWTSVVAKIKNTSLDEDWSDSTYAKPNDNIDWVYCYYPGVQKTYATNATTNHVSEWAGSPDNSYTLSYSPLSNGFFGTWQNYFSLAALGNFSPNWDPWTTSRSAGDSSVVKRNTAYTIERGESRNKAGDTLTGQITSGIPTYAGVSHHGSHSWPCHYQCNSSKCGTHCCGWTTTCSTGKDGKTSCTTTCSATCCNSCYVDTCSHSGDYISNSRSNVSAVDSASVSVPYNFINTSSVELNETEVNNVNEDWVYAGETATIKTLNVTVGTKYNSVTQGTYATQVDDAKVKLVAYASTSSTGSAKVGGSGKDQNICGLLSGYESCTELDSADGLLMNSSGNMSGDTVPYASTFDSKYSVYDTDAGKYFCVVAAVYPATSGGNTNLWAGGDNSWHVSAPSCKVIAKKPSFQVRGGAVYSANSMATFTSEKNNVRDVYGYTPLNSGITLVFGSWAEQGVISNGIVTGFASGAASGMTGSKEGETPNYCNYRTPLSIANYGVGLCPNTQQVGEAGITASATNKDNLVSYWWVMNPTEVSGTALDLNVNYEQTTTLQGDAIRYTYKDGHYSIVNTGELAAGVTHVVRSTGNITINSDLRYQNYNTASYSAMSFVPKLIIYAQGNIYINCSVGRIDAILIANGTVDTCVTSSNGANPGINDAARSKQLTINGAVLANKVKLERTYGAGAGKASAIPAEIINYDTSILLWGRKMAEEDDFETLQTVYQHELAPRY